MTGMKPSFFAAVITFVAAAAYPCSRMTPIDPVEMVKSADLIVVARAVGYDRPPANPNIITTGTPDSVVRFEIDEWVKGKGPTAIALTGYLSDADDFNDLDIPYRFVRRGGRRGSCFANTYREGGRFLLLLKLHRGAHTVDWYALGPTNEQLHDGEDRWLAWVRAEVASGSALATGHQVLPSAGPEGTVERSHSGAREVLRPLIRPSGTFSPRRGEKAVAFRCQARQCSGVGATRR